MLSLLAVSVTLAQEPSAPKAPQTPQKAEQAPAPSKPGTPGTPGAATALKTFPIYKPEDWKTFRSREGNFSVLLPTTPTEEIRRFGLQGGIAEEHRYTVPSADANYQVAYTYLSENLATPELVRQRFKSLLDNLKSNPDVTFIGGKSITYEGNPGIEFAVESSKGKILTNSRQYFGYGCIYEVTARSVRKDPPLKEPQMFIDSLKILGPPLSRPMYLVPAEQEFPDFTPLAGGSFSVRTKTLRENAIEHPAPNFKLTPGRSMAGRKVTVVVEISEDGKVLSADAIEGPENFAGEAMKTAKRWTFKPFIYKGKPVKVEGRLTFFIESEGK